MKSRWQGSDFSEDDIWQGGRCLSYRRRRKISGGKAASVLATRWRQRVPPFSTAVFQCRIAVVIYRGIPERLHHRVPHWVEPGALFHIRIRLEREEGQKALTDPALGQIILDSAKFYEANMRWHITLFLLMPDHLHAVLSFARSESMSEVIRDWKRFHNRVNHVIWQEGISIIGCVLTNAALSLQQNSITSGRIR